MSDFIIDTGKTRTEPVDSDIRFDPDHPVAAGCLGTIDCEKCGCIMAAKGSHCFCMGIYTCPRCGYDSEKMSFDEQIENAADKIGKSFNLTVTERIKTQPEFRKEILREVIECISSDDLLVAKKMLDQVIEADEGVDK